MTVAKAAQYTYKTNLNFCKKKVNFSRKVELMDFKESWQNLVRSFAIHYTALKLEIPYQKIPFSAMVINEDFFDFKHMVQENQETLSKESMFKLICMFIFII